MNVIGAVHPDKVVVSGEGLKGGLLGRDLDVRIDTRKAGPGMLHRSCNAHSYISWTRYDNFVFVHKCVVATPILCGA